MRDLEYEITLLRQRVDEIRRDFDALQQVLQLDALRQVTQSLPQDKPIVTIPHTKGVSDAEL